KSLHLLKELLYDDAGHLMTATHATKANVRYRYYVSRPSLHGEARTADLGSCARAPAEDIDKAVLSALRKHLADHNPEGVNRKDRSELDYDVLVSLVSR